MQHLDTAQQDELIYQKLLDSPSSWAELLDIAKEYNEEETQEEEVKFNQEKLSLPKNSILERQSTNKLSRQSTKQLEPDKECTKEATKDLVDQMGRERFFEISRTTLEYTESDKWLEIT